MKFSEKGPLAEELYEWWEDLHGIAPQENRDEYVGENPAGEDLQKIDSPKNQESTRKPDRAGRAALRRCATIAQITWVPAYQRLYHRLQQKGWSASLAQKDRLAAVAGLLAYVKENNEQPLAKTMSASTDGSDQPNVSMLRFRRLLDSPDLEALFTGLRRVLPLMKYQANVKVLAEDLIYRGWGDHVKKHWAYDYDWPTKSDNA